MIMNVLNSQEMFRLLEQTRMISRVPFTLAQFNNWIETINQINKLPYGMTLLNGYPLSDFKIPSQFSDMIVPVRIKVTEGSMNADFRGSVYTTTGAVITDTELMSPMDFNMISLNICGLRKVNNPTLSDVKALQVDKTLSNLLDEAYVQGTTECVATSTPYFPICVTTALKVPSAYTESLDSMFANWALNRILTIS